MMKSLKMQRKRRRSKLHVYSISVIRELEWREAERGKTPEAS